VKTLEVDNRQLVDSYKEQQDCQILKMKRWRFLNANIVVCVLDDLKIYAFRTDVARRATATITETIGELIAVCTQSLYNS
jgi:hypothetical protein